MKKKVLLWCQGIDDVIGGSNNVAGVPVLMGLWGRMLIEKNYSICSFTKESQPFVKDGFNFIPLNYSKILLKTKLLVTAELFIYDSILRKAKPDIVLIHASTRALFFLNIICKRRNIKLIYLGACDNDFVPGKEFLENRLDKLLFRKGLTHVNCVFTQNTFQQNQMEKVYRRPSVIVPNIGLAREDVKTKTKKFDFVWVANIKPLKRLEWFVTLANRLPEFSFAVVGGIQDRGYFEKVNKEADSLTNYQYLGALPLTDTTIVISQSKCLICTSEFEGFPNTFIQAFSNGVPVISTVDPSNVISNNKIGYHIESIDEMCDKCKALLSTNDYEMVSKNASQYFERNHSFESVYSIVKDFLV